MLAKSKKWSAFEWIKSIHSLRRQIRETKEQKAINRKTTTTLVLILIYLALFLWWEEWYRHIGEIWFSLSISFLSFSPLWPAHWSGTKEGRRHLNGHPKKGHQDVIGAHALNLSLIPIPLIFVSLSLSLCAVRLLFLCFPVPLARSLLLIVVPPPTLSLSLSWILLPLWIYVSISHAYVTLLSCMLAVNWCLYQKRRKKEKK